MINITKMSTTRMRRSITIIGLGLGNGLQLVADIWGRPSEPSTCDMTEVATVKA